MDYRKLGHAIYIRCDRNDEIVASILAVCQKERIRSANFNGIGGCASAAIQTFDPNAGEFHTEEKEGMLELVCMMGNVVSDEDGSLHHHTHALFSFMEDGEHKVLAGHLKETLVLYTAEIELRPADGTIERRYDPGTGTGFWSFGKEGNEP